MQSCKIHSVGSSCCGGVGCGSKVVVVVAVDVECDAVEFAAVVPYAVSALLPSIVQRGSIS